MTLTRRFILGVPAAALSRLLGANNKNISFDPLDHSNDGAIVVPQGYRVSLVAAWGMPLGATAPDLDVNAQTGATQSRQFGYNADFLGYFPLPDWTSRDSRSGLLSVNHESTASAAMFPGYRSGSPTKDQVDAELAAVGMSIIEVRRTAAGIWEYVYDSRFNRRLTGETVFEITGPAAGDDWMKSSYDSTGTRVRGTWGNCAGGKTPWGTVLSGEEGFAGLFANRNQMAEGGLRDLHTRFGVTAGASSRRWENFYDRFDMAKDPNEPNRFGWVVEVDPYNPTAAPKKRTALGRGMHEGATCRIAGDGRVVVYTGDDARFEYVYKFISANTFNSGNRAANLDLLDQGTLYAGRFNEDGSGEWIPLVFGQGPLTAANGFRSQADVLIKARLAADAVGATRMDRPEDVEANPVNGKVYIVCTNNDQRTASGANGVNAANPRATNRMGHIVELIEAGNDAAALTFRWSMFMLCGNPRIESHRPTFYGGFDQMRVSPVACPDNVAFDSKGSMWITTDGQASSTVFGVNEALFICPTEGAERGFARLFSTAPPGSEYTGPELTPDDETLFISIQHPRTWPDLTGTARPGVIAITKPPGASAPRIGD